LSRIVADVMDRHDVGVVAQTPHRLRFALHTRKPGFVQAFGLDDGDCYVPVQLGVVRQVNLLAPAFAQKAFDQVATAGKRCWKRG
jgi:hypothetical protein